MIGATFSVSLSAINFPIRQARQNRIGNRAPNRERASMPLRVGPEAVPVSGERRTDRFSCREWRGSRPQTARAGPVPDGDHVGRLFPAARQREDSECQRSFPRCARSLPRMDRACGGRLIIRRPALASAGGTIEPQMSERQCFAVQSAYDVGRSLRPVRKSDHLADSGEPVLLVLSLGVPLKVGNGVPANTSPSWPKMARNAGVPQCRGNHPARCRAGNRPARRRIADQPHRGLLRRMR